MKEKHQDKKEIKTSVWLFFCLFILFSLSAGSAFSDEEKKEKNAVGEFKTIKGDAYLIRDKNKVAIKVGESFILRDIAETDANSETLIFLNNNSLIILGGDLKSRLVLKEYSMEGKRGESVLFSPYGEMRVMTCEDRFEIETHVAEVNANGTLDFVIWESVIDGEPASCLAVLRGSVELKNKDSHVKDTVTVSGGYMSCVSVGETPSEPVSIPEELLETLLEKGDRDFTDNVCEDECEECERLNPQRICVPDNFKPCDDGNSCTVDDRCLGRKCKGKRDPSPTDPNCFNDDHDDNDDEKKDKD